MKSEKSFAILHIDYLTRNEIVVTNYLLGTYMARSSQATIESKLSTLACADILKSKLNSYAAYAAYQTQTHKYWKYW